MKQEIKKIIELAVSELDPAKSPVGHLGGLGFSIEIPEDKKNGDYSTNVALILANPSTPLRAGKLSKNPREVAESIKAKIKSDLFSKIEVAGPGFINFFIENKIFVDNLKKIDKNFGRGGELKNKKILVDYTDPNILKEFHIGHLMSNTIGESLCRIFEFQGAKVKRLCYQSDVGISVAKAIWGILQNKVNFPKDNASLSDKVKFLADAYVYGSEKYESDENAKKEIVILNKKIFERSLGRRPMGEADKEINKIHEKGKKWSLEHFDELYKKLGTKFDYFIFESEVSDLGKKIVEKGLGNGIFEKGLPAQAGENAPIVFKGEKYGLHTRVFINSEGLPTYEGKDLGLAETKFKKYAYDKSVIVTGSEVNEYFKVMLCAMDKVAPKLAEKTKHIGHGMLRLPEGKMSSRTGKVITGETLINKVEELITEKIKERELSKLERENITETVAVGAIKYSILKQSIGSDIIYDFDKSISFEGDSGPYLQYSYARAESVLRKAREEGVKPSFKKVPEELTKLEKTIYYFPEMVMQAGEVYEPHYLVLYLTKLAGVFNSYYAENKIVDAKDEFSSYKVALTNAFATTMENGMWLLGINTLEKM